MYRVQLSSGFILDEAGARRIRAQEAAIAEIQTLMMAKTLAMAQPSRHALHQREYRKRLNPTADYGNRCCGICGERAHDRRSCRLAPRMARGGIG